MNNLKANLQNVRSRVESACTRAGRLSSELTILAVSKRHPATKIRSLYGFGQTRFGENYVQEALSKQKELTDLDIEWHFIGPLQSNKTREIAEHFQWVQSADRRKVLTRLSNQRPASLPLLNVCLQVNIDREPQKAGLLPEEVKGMAQYVLGLPGLKLRGLMSIPKPPENDQQIFDSHRKMREIYDQLRDSGFDLDTLSMGMSSDLEAAIIEGSTMVRIGTDLLGPRTQPSGEEI